MKKAPKFPFPFIGSGDAGYFETARIYVQFTRNGTPNERLCATWEVPPPLQESVVWNARLLSASSSQMVNAEIALAYGNVKKRESKKVVQASAEAVDAFNRDTRRWLWQMHLLVPILFAYRPEDHEAGGTRFDAWHKWSIAQLPKVLASFTTKSDLAQHVREGIAQFAPARKLKKPSLDEWANLAGRGDLLAARMAFANAGGILSDDAMYTIASNTSPTRAEHAAMLVGMRDLIAAQKKPDVALVARMGSAACRLRHQKGLDRAVKADADATYAWVTGVAAKNHEVCGAMALFAGQAARGAQWKVAYDAYELALLDKHLEPDHYAEALEAITPELNGAPRDNERAKRWLALCLPHGKRSTAILVNAARLALALKDTQTAKDAVRKAVAGGHDKRALSRVHWFAPLRKHEDIVNLLA